MITRPVFTLFALCLASGATADPKTRIVDGINYHILDAPATSVRIIWVKTDAEGHFRFSSSDYVVEFPRCIGQDNLFDDVEGNFVGHGAAGPSLRISKFLAAARDFDR
jgi:hypothetical protein